MYKSSGQCRCGKTSVVIGLPEPLEQYSPRQCDCDFCMSRNILYLSNPEGKLIIESVSDLVSEQQGSKQAAFLSCAYCHTVIAATIQSGDKLIGAVNSTLLAEFNKLQPATLASPKHLSATEKVTRWQSLWLAITIKLS